MKMAVRRSHALLMAPLALALSATLALAGQPVGSTTGLSTGASNSGRTVPVKVSNDGSDSTDATETEAPDPTDTPDVTDATDTTDSGSASNCTTDPTNFTTDQFLAATHGSVVCWAAQQPTPDGYANHGAWVSHWAKLGKDGTSPTARTHGKSGLHKQ
jgi:hypothetical protein